MMQGSVADASADRTAADATTAGRAPTVRLRPSRAARAALVCILGVVLGALTAGGQQWLPDQLRSVANSSGSWALIAFLLARPAWRTGVAAAFGCLSLAGLLAGYVLFSGIRGYASSVTMIVFWGAAAAIVGPLLGLGSYWWKTRRDRLAALGVGAMSGVLVGEGVYGLLYIADTTYPPYWWGSIVVGVALLLAGVVLHLRRLVTGAIALAACVIVAAAFVVVYAADLLARL